MTRKPKAEQWNNPAPPSPIYQGADLVSSGTIPHSVHVTKLQTVSGTPVPVCQLSSKNEVGTQSDLINYRSLLQWSHTLMELTLGLCGCGLQAQQSPAEDGTGMKPWVMPQPPFTQVSVTKGPGNMKFNLWKFELSLKRLRPRLTVSSMQPAVNTVCNTSACGEIRKHWEGTITGKALTFSGKPAGLTASLRCMYTGTCMGSTREE